MPSDEEKPDAVDGPLTPPQDFVPVKRNLTPKQMWALEERKKKRQAELNSLKASDPAYDGPKTPEQEALFTDWDRLKLIAKRQFPARLAMQFDLRPLERLVGIAYVFGWSQEKIATAAKIDRRTVYRWLQRPELQEFIQAFEYHKGTRDAKELIEKEQYNSLLVMKEIRDDTTVSAATRADVSRWFYEQQHGKARETHVQETSPVRQLTEELMKARKVEPPPPQPDIADELLKAAKSSTVN